MTDQWLIDYYAAWNGTDPDEVVSFMTDDVEMEDVTAGHLSTGKAAARKFFEVCLERVPGATYEIVDSRSSDDAFWVEWVMHARGIAVRGSSVGTRRDGKIAKNHDFWNGALFQV